MKVLVTGASGFIGSTVCRELLKKGHLVAGLTATKRDVYLNEIKEHPRFTLYKGDITKKDSLKGLFNNAFHMVIHLAGVTPLATRKREDFFAINYYGTKHIVDLARAKNVEKMIYLSTTSIHKNSDYGKSKLEAEHYCKKMPHLIIVRSPGVYGRYKDTKALKLLIKGKLIPRALDFENSAPDFISVDYLADTIVSLIDALDYAKRKIVELKPYEKPSFKHLLLSTIDLMKAIFHGWQK